MTPQEYQAEIREIYRRAYEEHPGLERFRGRKKNLLLLVMVLFALQKLLDAAALGGGLAFLARLAGLIIPAIFVLAAWRGGWKLSLVLMLPAGMGLMSLFSDWLPLLRAGGDYLPLFYVAAALAALLPLTLAATTAWLVIPEKNRAYGDQLNHIHEELIALSKRLSQDPRRGDGGPKE